MKAIYFGTEHCPQCKVFKPKFEEACNKSGISYRLVDADECADFASHYGVRSIPYVVLINDDGTWAKGPAVDMIKNIQSTAL